MMCSPYETVVTPNRQRYDDQSLKEDGCINFHHNSETHSSIGTGSVTYLNNDLLLKSLKPIQKTESIYCCSTMISPETPIASSSSSQEDCLPSQCLFTLEQHQRRHLLDWNQQASSPFAMSLNDCYYKTHESQSEPGTLRAPRSAFSSTTCSPANGLPSSPQPSSESLPSPSLSGLCSSGKDDLMLTRTPAHDASSLSTLLNLLKPESTLPWLSRFPNIGGANTTTTTGGGGGGGYPTLLSPTDHLSSSYYNHNSHHHHNHHHPNLPLSVEMGSPIECGSSQSDSLAALASALSACLGGHPSEDIEAVSFKESPVEICHKHEDSYQEETQGQQCTNTVLQPKDLTGNNTIIQPVVFSFPEFPSFSITSYHDDLQNNAHDDDETPMQEDQENQKLQIPLRKSSLYVESHTIEETANTNTTTIRQRRSEQQLLLIESNDICEKEQEINNKSSCINNTNNSGVSYNHGGKILNSCTGEASPKHCTNISIIDSHSPLSSQPSQSFKNPSSLIPLPPAEEELLMSGNINQCDEVTCFTNQSTVTSSCGFNPDGTLQLTFFKTSLCPNESFLHDRKNCPFYHSLRDKRRHPVCYKAEQCPYQFDSEAEVVCKHGDGCDKCHNHHELLYHPDIYRQRFCSSYNNLECQRGRFCAFAHTRKEIRCQLFLETDETNPGSEFFMMHFKTLWCPYGVQHDWHGCLYAHTYQDCRRSPWIGYGSEPCPYWQKDLHSANYQKRCPYGPRCPYSHGSKEQLYHPAYYKTMPCADYRLKRRCPRQQLCAFYHDPAERRIPGQAAYLVPSEGVKENSATVAALSIERGPIPRLVYDYSQPIPPDVISLLQPSFMRPPLFNLDDFEAFGHNTRNINPNTSSWIERTADDNATTLTTTIELDQISNVIKDKLEDSLSQQPVVTTSSSYQHCVPNDTKNSIAPINNFHCHPVSSLTNECHVVATPTLLQSDSHEIMASHQSSSIYNNNNYKKHHRILSSIESKEEDYNNPIYEKNNMTISHEKSTEQSQPILLSSKSTTAQSSTRLSIKDNNNNNNGYKQSYNQSPLTSYHGRVLKQPQQTLLEYHNSTTTLPTSNKIQDITYRHSESYTTDRQSNHNYYHPNKEIPPFPNTQQWDCNKHFLNSSSCLLPLNDPQHLVNLKNFDDAYCSHNNNQLESTLAPSLAMYNINQTGIPKTMRYPESKQEPIMHRQPEFSNSTYYGKWSIPYNNSKPPTPLPEYHHQHYTNNEQQQYYNNECHYYKHNGNKFPTLLSQQQQPLMSQNIKYRSVYHHRHNNNNNTMLTTHDNNNKSLLLPPSSEGHRHSMMSRSLFENYNDNNSRAHNKTNRHNNNNNVVTCTKQL